jgi:uncharacterized protein YjiS (DUF1127 family)
MAFATYTTTTIPGASLFARISSYVADLKAARLRRNEYLRTVAELSAMQDRELADLGISRYDIHDIAARHYL